MCDPRKAFEHITTNFGTRIVVAVGDCGDCASSSPLANSDNSVIGVVGGDCVEAIVGGGGGGVVTKSNADGMVTAS